MKTMKIRGARLFQREQRVSERKSRFGEYTQYSELQQSPFCEATLVKTMFVQLRRIFQKKQLLVVYSLKRVSFHSSQAPSEKN
jgi:hypothetical protein